jgi:protein SCO1/2
MTEDQEVHDSRPEVDDGGSPLERVLVPGLVVAAIVLAAAALLISRSLTSQGTGGDGTSAGRDDVSTAGLQGDPLDFAGFAIDPPRTAYDFEMPSQTGEPFRISDARGKVVLLTFGYTFCPDVCPNTLNKLAYAMQDLGELADEVQVVFVSVDPERDTPEGMGAFLENYDPRFLGLVGNMDDIEAAASEYGVAFYKEYPPDEGEESDFYTIAHSATVFLIDREGRLRSSLLGPYTPEDAAHDIRLLLAE